MEGESERPFDTLGSAADPIPFPRPRLNKGIRSSVVCYNAETGTHETLENVLMRDFQRSFAATGTTRLEDAYWPIPYKEKISTIMGHVEICLLLKRMAPRAPDSDADDMTDSDTDEDPDPDDEEIIFEATGTRVAVKVNYHDRMERLRDRHAEDPLKETAAMQLIGCEHPHVLGCLDVLHDGSNLNVVMQYCDSGDLFQLLQDRMADPSAEAPGLSEGNARFWFRQLISGIKHLHSVGVCHRDLSPENVMLDGQNCLIIDMGMCLRVPYSDDSDNVVDVSKGMRRRLIRPQGTAGKLPYMSPEIYRNRRDFDGEAIDLWTAGTILFCMLTGNRSYQRPHSSDPQFYWMTRGLTQLLSDWQVQLSPEGVHLLQNLLQVEPRQRLTLDEVVNHPWFDFPDEPMLVAR